MSDFSIGPSEAASPARKNNAQNGNVELKPKTSTSTREELASKISSTDTVDKKSAEEKHGDEQVKAESNVTIEDAVVKLEAFTQSIGRDLVFRVDESTGRTIVSVIDRETKEVIREIPGEDALKLSQEIDQMRSLIFSVKA